MHAISSKILVTLFVIASCFASGAFFVVRVNTQQATAASSSEWQIIREALDTAMQNQFVENDLANEYGFLIDSYALHARIDSNGDGQYLGEGDEAAGNPVLIDVLISTETKLPTTALRSNAWTTTFQTQNVDAIAELVRDHEAAGFSNDIVVYGADGTHEASVGGGLLAYAGAGGFGESDEHKVLVLKWGRFGWGIGWYGFFYNNKYPIGPPDTLPDPSYPFASNPGVCNGTAPNAELVRCVAEWALRRDGGNVSTASPPVDYRFIDIRPEGGTTIDDDYFATLNVPIDTIFNSGLTYLYPTGVEKLFVGRTHHVPGIIATGAEMLGYDSKFLKWGLAHYNNALPEQFSFPGPNYGEIPGDTPVDSAAPIVTSGPIATEVTGNSARIGRIANEPATMKIEYGTAPGSYTGLTNDTVLNADKTVTLTGLDAGTVYYYRVTSYDGQANSASSAELTFQTHTCGEPALGIGPVNAFWASYADYEARSLSVDYPLHNRGTTTALDINIAGSIATNGVMLASPMPVSTGAMAPGSSRVFTLIYSVPPGVASFLTSITATARDECSVAYTYGAPVS